MKFSRRRFIGASIASGVAIAAPATFAAPERKAPQLSPLLPATGRRTERSGMIQSALAALHQHSNKVIERDRIGIADFSLHSKEMRFHIANVFAGEIESSYLVSHGRGSDPANSGYVERFSNLPGSHASSRGSYLTGETYFGKHGKSRRLHGLDEYNDMAFERAIVIHGADYVDRDMAILQGRVGRSLGCFAFERSVIGEVLEKLGPGRLLFSTK